MSIEQDIKRMADANERMAAALEYIVESMKGDTETIKKTKKAKETPPPAELVHTPAPATVPLAPAPTVAAPGIGGFVPPAPAPFAAVAPAAAVVSVVSSGEELRQMAQRIAQKLGANTMPFVTWVTQMLVPYGVNNVAYVPADKLQEVAGKLDGYAKEKGVAY